MDIKLKHRLVGACVILALAVFFLPMILDSEKYRADIETQIPQDSALHNTSNSPSTATEDSGTLTINLKEDEPEKAIEEPEASVAVVEESKGTTDKEGSAPAETDPVNSQSPEESPQQKPAKEIAADASKSVDETGSELTSQPENTDVTSSENVVKQPVEESEKEKQAPVTEQTRFQEQAWVIQIGSFSNKDNALGLVSKLRTQGYRAYHRMSGEYTRVYVGPYPDEVAAEKRQPGLEEIIGTPVKLIEFDAQHH
ncbi:SPOR domain-containing protein [Kangiella shandongensis]|uniref:SPOR domain-containing protein n=1 Tax=Kangiella shandongensis TaxID=2763258 RepID=UPI001CBBFC9C|nr:SPOR domain-containing protein [Kangiella shandongensis]